MKYLAFPSFRPLTFPFLVVALLAGCEEASSSKEKLQQQEAVAPTAPPSPHGKNPHSAGAPTAHGSAATKKPEVAIVWEVPSSWKEVPSLSRMRHATYSAPGDTGPAEISVFYFGPGQGGDIDSNISRWVGQFKDTGSDAVSRDVRQSHGLTQSVVSVSRGTFSSGMPGGPKGPQEDWGLEGAIVEAPSGRYFFKMTGPGETVDKNREAFAALLASIQVKD